MKKLKYTIIFIVVLAMVLSACANPVATPTTEPVATQAPVVGEATAACRFTLHIGQRVRKE